MWTIAVSAGCGERVERSQKEQGCGHSTNGSLGPKRAPVRILRNLRALTSAQPSLIPKPQTLSPQCSAQEPDL